jgi:hypothetical protein
MIGWIIWGSGGNSVDLGVTEHRHCEICERERPFATVLQYRYAHPYWIFSWITEKHYSLLCTICSRGWELNAREIEKALPNNPIPFMRRWGWALLVAPFACLFLSSLIGSLFRHR